MIVEPLILDHDRKTTLPGLREAFSSLPPPPPALSFADYAALPTDDRSAYDQARDDFLRLTLRVPTPSKTSAPASSPSSSVPIPAARTPAGDS